MQRGRQRWRRWVAASAGALGVALCCATAGAVPGTTRTMALPALQLGGGVQVHDLYASISCRTVGACTVVGTGGGTYGIADVQQGNHWRLPQVIGASPAGGTEARSATIASVACPTQGHCVAVGSYVTPGARTELEYLTEGPSGWTWTSAVPTPAGTKEAALDAIWCAREGTCVVAGSVLKATGTTSEPAFVDVLAAGVWRPSVTLPNPSPPGATSSLAVAPSSISCRTTSDCVVVGAVGPTAIPGAHYGFAEVDRSGTWTPSVVAPGATTRDRLTSVDCASTAMCVAVGSVGPTLTRNGDLAPFAEIYAHGAWGHQRLLNWKFWAPETYGGRLTGVSCPSVRRCLAVGQLDLADASDAPSEVGSLPVVFTMTDDVWTNPAIATAPATQGSPSAGATVNAITCTSAHYCEAVGASTPRSPSLLGVYPFSTVTEVYSRGTAPGAVSGVAVTRSHGIFDVTWHGPTSFGGSPIRSYFVVARSPHERSIQCLTVTHVVPALQGGAGPRLHARRHRHQRGRAARADAAPSDPRHLATTASRARRRPSAGRAPARRRCCAARPRCRPRS